MTLGTVPHTAEMNEPSNTPTQLLPKVDFITRSTKSGLKIQHNIIQNFNEDSHIMKTKHRVKLSLHDKVWEKTNKMFVFLDFMAIVEWP